MSQENEAYRQLCELTTELFPKFGARPAAFKAACEQRPDLAAAAVYPSGEPVIPREGAAAAAKPPASRTFEDEMAACASSPLVQAAERCAQEAARTK